MADDPLVVGCVRAGLQPSSRDETERLDYQDSADGSDLRRALDGTAPRDHEIWRRSFEERDRPALAIQFQGTAPVEPGPAFIVECDRLQHVRIKLGKVGKRNARSQISRQRGVIWLRDQPPLARRLLLRALDGVPRWNDVFPTYIRRRVQRIENHAGQSALSIWHSAPSPLGLLSLSIGRGELPREFRGYVLMLSAPHLGMRLAWRSRMARTAPGPVPVGGLRIPSSRSFSTTALLRCSSLDANRSVSRFRRPASRYSLFSASAASGRASSLR